MPDPSNKFRNELINESSPYLLQHAHNPVNWLSWNEASLKKAVEENKLILISIGYSSCHWCHVMEQESFEDEETAAIMNKHYICIKVDREERPDVDAIYMSAVQLITGRGGWPLNCITLPDQRPIYGGTYFPKSEWQKILLQVAALYKNDPAQCAIYANDLTQGIHNMEVVQRSISSFEKLEIDAYSLGKKMESQFDKELGGMNRAPKFPMPSNWEFVLHLFHHTGEKKLLKQVEQTLTKMAFGGINDQLAGGFARYSTDIFWKVPHFEKMLYDNAQLVSLYAHAFLVTHDPLYKKVVQETLSFVKNEMTSSEGGFYSALDADSEGVEGKYYCWNKLELADSLRENAAVFYDYYNVNEFGYWEDNQYILMRDKPDEEVAAMHNLTEKKLLSIISECKKKLLEQRNKRIRPGLDDKQICSWNALMLKGYIDASVALHDEEYKTTAIHSAQFILDHFVSDNKLFRIYKEGKLKIHGYLDDYAFVIDALIALYQLTHDLKWLSAAKEFTIIVIKDFFDMESGLFFFTSKNDEPLIARKMEIQDNVIPSASSAMAKNLFLLGKYYSTPEYISMAEQMVLNVAEEITKSTPWYSNWAQVAIMMKNTFYEIVICGDDSEVFYQSFTNYYLPNSLFAVAKAETSLPLFENRLVAGKTLIYICTNNSCLTPLTSVEDAMKFITNN